MALSLKFADEDFFLHLTIHRGMNRRVISPESETLCDSFFQLDQSSLSPLKQSPFEDE